MERDGVLSRVVKKSSQSVQLGSWNCPDGAVSSVSGRDDQSF